MGPSAADFFGQEPFFAKPEPPLESPGNRGHTGHVSCCGKIDSEGWRINEGSQDYGRLYHNRAQLRS